MATLTGTAPKEFGKWFVDGTVTDPNIAVGYQIIWDGESFNTFIGASPMNAATGVFTFPSAGIYRVNCQIVLLDHVEGDTARYQLNLPIDGTSQLITRYDATADMNFLSQSVNGLVTVSAGDTMTAQLFASINSADIDGSADCYSFLCVEKIT